MSSGVRGDGPLDVSFPMFVADGARRPGVHAATGVRSLAIRRRLYAAPTRYEACSVRSRPLNRVFRKFATVFIQPKISSTRLRIRRLISYPRCRVVRPSMAVEDQSDVLVDPGQVRNCVVRGVGVVFSDKLVYGPLVLVLLLQLPVEKGADREVRHYRIEQSFDLFRAPYELSLDGGQIEIRVDLTDHVADANRAVFHGSSRSARSIRRPPLSVSSKATTQADSAEQERFSSFDRPRVSPLGGPEDSGSQRPQRHGQGLCAPRPRLPGDSGQSAAHRQAPKLGRGAHKKGTFWSAGGQKAGGGPKS